MYLLMIINCGLARLNFYNNGKRGIKALIDDLNTHFKHDYLKEQFVIISRALIHNNELREEWIQKLNEATRLEDKLDMIIIPLLCVYEDTVADEIISAINAGTDADTIYLEHVSELKKYFDENNTFTNKERVQTLLILLPVESKDKKLFLECFRKSIACKIYRRCICDRN